MPHTDSGRLLVVDWDFFFPNPIMRTDTSLKDALLYDWQTVENGQHQEPHGNASRTIWAIRAAQFLCAGQPLPTPDPAYRAFWSRVRLAPGAEIHVHDSNVWSYCAAETMPDLTGVDLFDAHHDLGAYPAQLPLQELHCGNWLTALRQDYGMDAQVYLPPWRDNPHHPELDPADPYVPRDILLPHQKLPDHTYSRVSICRSPAWVPPWCDNAFEEFITDPALARHPYAFDNYTGVRPWSLREAMKHVAVNAAARGQMGRSCARGDLDTITSVLAAQATQNPTHPDLHTVGLDLDTGEVHALIPLLLDISHNDHTGLAKMITAETGLTPPADTDTLTWRANLVYYPSIKAWDVEWTAATDPAHLPANGLRHRS